MTAGAPPVPPPLENRPSAAITTRPATISQIEEERFCFGAGKPGFSRLKNKRWAGRRPPATAILAGRSRQQPILHEFGVFVLFAQERDSARHGDKMADPLAHPEPGDRPCQQSFG